jgi:hypothetical protein
LYLNPNRANGEYFLQKNNTLIDFLIPGNIPTEDKIPPFDYARQLEPISVDELVEFAKPAL